MQRLGQNAPVGLVVSLIVIAVGAILTWAVSNEPSGLDLDVVGVILMIVGLIGFLLTLLFWSSWWGPGYWYGGRRATYVEGAPRRGWYGARRTTYVEDDVPPQGPPP